MTEIVKRQLVMLCAVIIVTIMFLPFVSGGQLISSRQMERFGLVRVWYNQLAVNTELAKLQHVTIEGDTLFAVSSDAKIHAINTANGKLLWTRVLGRRELQHQVPAANSRIVAVVNNIELFIFDRKTGKLLLYSPLPNSVSVTACEVSENYVYIPMLGGRIIVYPIEEGVAEKIFNMKTGEYEDANPVVSRQPLPENQPNTPEQVAAEAAKKRSDVLAMKAVTTGDLESRDNVVADIVESFAQAKHSILAKPQTPPAEQQFVLRPALNFPMSTISFGDLTIQPKISTQIVKIDPADKSLKMHWEILTWVNKDGDFHTSIIRDLSQSKIDQLYKVSSPTKLFKPEISQIAERDWKIDKDIVVRPTTSQTVPYFYSGTNFDRRMVPDLSVLGAKSGYVFAIKNRNGEIAWHFVANGAVTERIGVIGLDVFVATRNGMYDLDLLTGKEKWYAPNIKKFLCASKVRAYVQDKHGYLVILDRLSGSRIAVLDLRKFRDVLFNIETDRLFIVDDSGLIQCFAERQADTAGSSIRSVARPIPEIRHRLSAAQYANATMGKEIPDLYWVTSSGLSGKSTKEDAVNSDNINAENTGSNNIDNQPASTTPDPNTTTTTTETPSTDNPSTPDSENPNPPPTENPTTPDPNNSPPTDNPTTPDPNNPPSTDNPSTSDPNNPPSEAPEPLI
ncbi:MAG: PQQ-binding-like beta-propeller repeat protein [Planctomycetaceae bacterium]|nr:PQQ-binding-like beta-propeller repeat protein [Planctomycetaceae bacterium]